MRHSLSTILILVLLPAILKGQVTGTGTAVFFDSTGFSDAIRLTMTNVSGPAGGSEFVAWLGNDDDVQFTKLGTVSVVGGNGTLIYGDPSGNNLLTGHKNFLITLETSPFSGSSPSLSSVIWADSLHGAGAPGIDAPLTRLRNCLSTFSNTSGNFGLAIWLLKHIPDYLSHTALARDGALANNTGEARTHSDHVYDFIRGKLLNASHGSIANNNDPVGYGFRRYGDPGTKDSSQGGAGYLGGAGYYVKLLIDDPQATPSMRASGSSALRALLNVFGATNDSGWAMEVTTRAANINNGVYVVNGTLPGEGIPFYNLAVRLINGTVGAGDTASVTGGIRQAYYHMQRMAGFVLEEPVVSDVGDWNATIPSWFALGPNFPNPFNGGTSIPFNLPHASRVSVAVFDPLGRMVSSIVKDVEFAAGVHRVSWAGEDLASGTYFYRLVAVPLAGSPAFIQTRRLIYLK